MMKSVIEYKGYIGSIEFSQEDEIFYGKAQGIKALISYEGSSAKEMLLDFKTAIDSYLEYCALENKKPEITYKGSFNVRV